MADKHSDKDNDKIKGETKGFGRKYHIPDIETILPVVGNKFHSCKELNDWIEWCYKLSDMSKDKFDRVADTGYFASYFYPHCKDIERYKVLVKYMIFFFVNDTQQDSMWTDKNYEQDLESWKQFHTMLNKILDPSLQINTSDWKPFVIAWYLTFVDITNTYNVIQRKRFVKSWRLYGEGCVLETEFLAKGQTFASLKQYLDIRTLSIGVWPSLQIIEYSDNIELSEQDWNDDRLVEMGKLSSTHILVVNDIYSFEKEMVECDGDISKVINSVAVLSIVESISIETAIQRVFAMIGQIEQDLKRLGDSISKDQSSSHVKKVFVDRLYYLTGGNIGAHRDSIRYKKWNLD